MKGAPPTPGAGPGRGVPEESQPWVDQLPGADFAWTAERLIVETDGCGCHGTRHGFENDRRRDQRARLAGWEPVRFTRRQLLREPDWVVTTTAALLAR